MADEKPFYIRQLPKEAQDWLKDKAYKSFIADGDKEEDAQKKAEDFLDEKVYTAEEMYGKDFLNEVGKGKEPKVEVDDDELYDQMESMGDLPSDTQLHRDLKKIDINDNGKVEVDELDAYTKDLEDYLDKNPDAKKKNYY